MVDANTAEYPKKNSRLLLRSLWNIYGRNHIFATMTRCVTPPRIWPGLVQNAISIKLLKHKRLIQRQARCAHCLTREGTSGRIILTHYLVAASRDKRQKVTPHERH